MAEPKDRAGPTVRASHGAWRKAVNRCLNAIPFVGRAVRRVYFGAMQKGFAGSADYWERRYRAGRNSGAGSFGVLAAFKADFLNAFVRDNAIKTIVEFGCGDGEQLKLANYPRYHGIDVSQAAIDHCRTLYRDDPGKTFGMDIHGGPYDLALSLDVIYHLVEDPVFDAYMRDLFAAAQRYVIVYASNRDMAAPEPHMRHRKFTDWVEANAPQWRLQHMLPNRYPFDPRNPDTTSFADFFIFEPRVTA